MARHPAIPARTLRQRGLDVRIKAVEFDIPDEESIAMKACRGYAGELVTRLGGLDAAWRGYREFVQKNVTVQKTQAGGVGVFVPESRAVVERMSATGVFRVSDEQAVLARDDAMSKSKMVIS